MRPLRESNVTPVPALTLNHPADAADPTAPPRGVWRLSNGALSIVDADGPATVLVPAESVLMLVADLPLATRAKRVEALPFAIEDRISEPLDTVHLALGREVAPKRYLVGVVRHAVMAEWVAVADAAGLGQAAIVPDALALPAPDDGAWTVDVAGQRAIVRTTDGTGFAVPVSLLAAAWEKAGRPPVRASGDGLPEAMAASASALRPPGLAETLAQPALDLRQGAYARRARPIPAFGRRLAWIVGAAVLAHSVIAVADVAMLNVIAERRKDEAMQLYALAAPNQPVPDGDLITAVADRLPASGVGGGAASPFLPLVSRISAALAPVSTEIDVRRMSFQGNSLVIEVAPMVGLAARARTALAGAGVAAQVAEAPDGSIRISASGA